MIETWYLEQLRAESAPSSMQELRERFTARSCAPSDLPSGEKWEPIIAGRKSDMPLGWTELSELASFRRGIATGCNSFFLLSVDEANRLGIQEQHRRVCVGRSADVSGLRFTAEDVEKLRKMGKRVTLLDFSSDLSPAEQNYIDEGIALGVHKRYLLKTRKPWFSMEKRPPASIWAAVFGRGDLRFVLNEANALSLTNFHCVFPKVESIAFAKVLCLVLNSSIVRKRFDQAGRSYGGGLKKFEPNDLKRIQLPDVRSLSESSLQKLAQLFDDETKENSRTLLSRYCEEILGQMLSST